MDSHGHTILLTGATSGIGLEMAKRLLSLGNRVIGIGRNAIVLEQLVNQYPAFIPIQADLTSPAEFNRLVETLNRDFGQLNMIINNAAIQYNYDINNELTLAQQTLELEVQTNQLVPIKLIYSLLPLIKKNPRPAIINITTGLTIVPKHSAPIYCATKAALASFTTSLRAQLPHVYVVEVVPPLVDTPMTVGRGTSKLSTAKLVNELLEGLKRDRHRIDIGKVRLFRLIHRFAPFLANKLING